MNESGDAAGGEQFTRGSVALLISVAANALGGLALWLVAARLHETAAVGDATALFQSVLFVNFASSLGLPVLIAHFAVGRTARATQISNLAMRLRTVSAALAAGVFLIAGATSDLLDPLWAMGTSMAALTYVVLSVGAGLSVVFEARLITLRRWNLVIVRSVLVAVSRLPLVLLVATDAVGDDAVQALFLFAVGPLALSGFLGMIWLRLTIDRPDPGARRHPHDLRHLGNYAAVNWLGLVFTQGPIFMIPVIVAFSVDGAENAPFYVAWSFGAITFLLPQMIGQIVLSEATQSPSWVRLLFRALRLALVLTMVSGVAALVGAPIVAAVYGSGFESVADHLPLVVGAGIGWSYISIGLAASRLRERYQDIVLISAIFLVSTVGTTLYFTPRHGAAAATWCWLFGNCFTAAITALRYRQWRLDDDVIDSLPLEDRHGSFTAGSMADVVDGRRHGDRSMTSVMRGFRRVVASMVVVVAVAGCSGESDDARLEPEATTPLAEGDDAAPTPTPAPGTIIAEGFDGPSADLDDQALPWRVVEGRWTANGGTLALREAAGTFPSLVVTDIGGPDGSIQVTAIEVANNTGLVFRYRDRSNYWALLAAPAFVTWNLVKVVDGETELVGNTDVSTTEPFTSLGVRLDGSTIEATINGRARLSIDDAILSDETTAGIIAGGDKSLEGRWDDFFAIGIQTIDPASDPTPDALIETPAFDLGLDPEEVPTPTVESEPPQ